MVKGYSWAMLLAWVATALTLSAYEPRFTVRTSNHATAVYHLACITDQIGCTKKKFGEHAKHPSVEEWKAAFAELKPEPANETRPSPFPANTLGMHPEVRLRARTLEAALDARSAGDLARRARIDPDVARKMWRALDGMKRALGDTRSAVRRHVAPTQRILKDPRLTGLARKVGALLEPGQASERIELHLIPSPEPKTDEAMGTFIGHHAVIELTDGAKPEFAASVALHETIHYLYDSVPTKAHRDRIEMFVARQHPRASSFYALFNEALAVATQHLLTRRMQWREEKKSDEEMYRHSYVPRAGRVLAPIVEQWIAERRRFDGELVKAYEEACLREFAADLADPRFVLVSSVFLPSNAGESAFGTVMSALQPVSWVRGGNWQQYTHLPIVLFGNHDDLKTIRAAHPEIAKLAVQQSFVVSKESERRPLVVLGGNDPDSITRAAQALLATPRLPKRVAFPSPDGGTVAALDYGGGPRAILLSHGGRFNKESWSIQVPVFVKAGFRVLAIDLRGLGETKGPGQDNPMDAPLYNDVLGAVRYLRQSGTTDVSVIGASLGGGAAFDALVKMNPGEIDRVIGLGSAGGSLPEERYTGPKLCIWTRNDASGTALRLPGQQAAFAKMPEPKRFVLLEGEAHAQFMFDTDLADRVMKEILDFLGPPKR
ncbi:MAG: alpha/beta hydrolase [Bryobacteraceae bacterium]|nr:alpha/beta hydrolase [Bryobacteraceae bacterium]